MKGWIIGALILAITSGIFSIFGKANLIPQTFPIIGEIANSLIVQSYSCLGAIVVIGIFFLSALSYVPADVHEKQEKINKEQEELINPKVNLKISQFTPEAHADGEKWVGLHIHNSSGVCAIKKCKVSLLGFYPSVRGTSNLPADLAWSANNQPDANGFVEIPRNGQKTLDVAWSFPNQNYGLAGIVLVRGFNVISFPPEEYEIEFRIDGEINDVPIPAQIYSAKIILEQGKDIRIIDIIKRNES